MKALSPVAAALFSMLSILLLTGCESTQSKSARLAKGSKGALREKGVVVGRQNPRVKVESTDAIQDGNGTAVVLDLRNKDGRALADLPVSINVEGAGGKSLFKNDTPGLAASLVEVPLLLPGRRFLWVNDQVNASGRPRRVEAKVGEGRRRTPKALPKLAVSGVKLRQDPVDGPEAVGFVVNRSGVDQHKLVVFGVSRLGRKVVAAGRAQVNRLRARKRARFQLFFIGDPRRGRLSLSAPPTDFK